MAEFIDASVNVAKAVGCLRREGVRGVIRYYNRDNTPKVIRRPEVDTILASGLELAIVHQRGGRDPGEYTAETGQLDAAHCREYGATMGQPSGSAIYFAVDFDIARADITRHLVPFFTAVRAAMRAESPLPQYRVGVYGSGLTCRTLLDGGLVDLTWLSQSTGFTESRAFRASNRWNLLQLLPETLCGLDHDPDIVGPSTPDFGQFDAAGARAVATPAPAATTVRLKVIARDGARLRSGPGLDFDKTGLIPFGTIVHSVGSTNDWTKVDLRGDGRLDGFVFTALLARA